MNIFNIIKKFYFEIILLIILVIMFQSYWPIWFSGWSDIESPYAFAFFVFAFIVYFIKINYVNLANVPKNPSNKGILLVLSGLFFYVVGLRADINYMVSLSLPVLVGGIIFTLYGTELFKKLLKPLILLTFTFPIFPIHRITIPLQGLSAHLTSDFLNFLGVNSFCEGSIVNVEHYKLSVVAGCSGLRSLITLFFTSIIFTYFIKADKLKKTLFVLFTIPLSIIMNVSRISLVGFYAIYNGYGGLEKFHNDLGIVTSIISMSILVIIAKFIDNDGGKNEA